MQKEQAADRPNRIKRTMIVLKTGPDVSTAAKSGPPTMTPASESGDETIGMALAPNAAVAAPSSIGNTATVETVTPGSPNALPDPPAPTPATTTPPATDAAPAPSQSAPAAAPTDSSQPAATGSSTDSSTQPASTTTPADSSQESTSKKKSGLRKLIPF
jgi:hypothetical protein